MRKWFLNVRNGWVAPQEQVEFEIEKEEIKRIEAKLPPINYYSFLMKFTSKKGAQAAQAVIFQRLAEQAENQVRLK